MTKCRRTNISPTATRSQSEKERAPGEERQAMIALISRSFRLWLGHENDSIKRRAQALDSVEIATKMGDDHAIQDRLSCFVGSEDTHSLQCDLANTVQQPVKRRVVEIDEWRAPACYSGYTASNTGDLLYRRPDLWICQTWSASFVE